MTQANALQNADPASTFWTGDQAAAFMSEEGTAPWAKPRLVASAGTTATTMIDSIDTLKDERRIEAPITRPVLRAVVDSTPIQIWEGTVIEVDSEHSTMQVILDAKMGVVPRHTGAIDLEWVAEQDLCLVRPGAVFYLTLFKRTMRGSIQNAQELRFRRRPSWSDEQIRRVQDAADTVLANMKALPLAE